MAGVTAQGGTFTFIGFSAKITRISVEAPTAEVVDMTGAADPIDANLLVPTGAWKGGSVSVDYVCQKGGQDPTDFVRKYGKLEFKSDGYSVSTNAILESSTNEAAVNDIVRGTLKFRVTDYKG